MAAPESGLHPIAAVLATVLQDGPDDTPILTADGIDTIRLALDEFVEAGPALMGAVDCLLTAAHLLEVEQHARSTAEALVELVDAPHVIEALIRINEAKEAERAEAVAKTAGEFQKFTAREDSKKPSEEPEEASQDGKLKLDAFHFPKRL